MNRAVIVNPAWSSGNREAPRLIDADLPVPQLFPRDVLRAANKTVRDGERR